MHLCFIDESGTPSKLGKNDPRFFVIAAAVIPDGVWHVVREKLVGLKREKKYHGEVKWRFFAPNNNDEDNPMKAWGQSEKDEFRDRIFRIISEQRSIKERLKNRLVSA